MLTTAKLWLNTLKQRLTQNVQWLTISSPIARAKNDLDKEKLSCSMIKQI